jgi:hypothetical protein
MNNAEEGLSIPCLLLVFCVLASCQSANDETSVIRRVKTTLASSLDSNLPRVTLDFFLEYEGERSPIKWTVGDCEPTSNSAVSPESDPAICVKANFDLKDRAATVLMSVGTCNRGPVDAPVVHSVRVDYLFGAARRLRRLSDLPAELLRPAPKGPRDLPDHLPPT